MNQPQSQISGILLWIASDWRWGKQKGNQSGAFRANRGPGINKTEEVGRERTLIGLDGQSKDTPFGFIKNIVLFVEIKNSNITEPLLAQIASYQPS